MSAKEKAIEEVNMSPFYNFLEKDCKYYDKGMCVFHNSSDCRQDCGVPGMDCVHKCEMEGPCFNDAIKTEAIIREAKREEREDILKNWKECDSSIVCSNQLRLRRLSFGEKTK